MIKIGFTLLKNDFNLKDHFIHHLLLKSFQPSNKNIVLSLKLSTHKELIEKTCRLIYVYK